MTLKSVGIKDRRAIEHLQRPLRQWPATSLIPDKPLRVAQMDARVLDQQP